MMKIKVIASAAVSLDGYLDDCSAERLVLSSAEDWRAIYALRAQCDAILVGAGTLRADNPSLMLKGENVAGQRIARMQNPEIARVTVTESGDLDASLRFFEGAGEKIVFVSEQTDTERVERLRMRAEVVVLKQITARAMVGELALRGYRTLMVEGGGETLTSFFTEGMVDRLRLAVAPFFVGNCSAPRFVGEGRFPYNKARRMALEGVEQVGDMAVMSYRLERSTVGLPLERYSITEQDALMLARTVELSRLSPPSESCYRVGSVVVTASGSIYEGYTHQTNDTNHAEEEAIATALEAGETLAGATIYASMEPCSKRSSKPKSCSELIIENRFARVVFAAAEPDCFVACEGAKMLTDAGVELVTAAYLDYRVRAVNGHLEL